MKCLFCCLCLFLPVFLTAQNYPDKPTGYITDRVGVLSAEQVSDLNTKLHDFEKSTSNQIFVFIDRSLNGQDMEQTCQALFHHWQIGQQNKNNGVLIGVFVNDHKFRIHTGYGLEGVLPDLLTKRIQDSVMRPYFREKDYYGGLNAGIYRLIYYSQNEYTAEVKDEEGTNWAMYIAYIVNFALLLIALTFFNRVSKKGSTRVIAGIGLVVASLLPFAGALIFIILFTTLYRGKAKRNNKRRSAPGSSSDSSLIFLSSDSSSDSGSSGSSPDSDFGGGGGGDSGGGGSDSDW